MATEHNGLLDQSIPQWKRELILRRRAVGRVLPAGSGSVQLTCPSVVAAVRSPESSVSSDFHLRRIASCEREETVSGSFKNMRLVEQVNTSGNSGVILDLKDLMTYSKKHAKMGEEKNMKNNNTDKKSNGECLEEDQLSDSSEEFKYGPGIVSKLKSRYLSLTLRENQGKVRPSLASLRRATSLENILDEPEPEKTEEKPKFVKNVQPVNGNAVQRCRNISRGNRDSMKRARSVEALMRYDRGLATATLNRRSLDNYSKICEEESEETRKFRNRTSSSNLEEKELPPPDVVKHTLQIFENSSKNNTSTLPKKSENKISAKPTISPKPVLTGKIKQNGANTPVKSPTSKIQSPESPKKSPEKKSKNKTTTTTTTTTSPVLKKDSVITNNKPSNEIEPSKPEQDSPDGEAKSKPLICSNINKNQMTLHLNKVNSYAIPKHKSSPTSTSPKSNSDKKIEETIRPISPVLVKAPPSILSTELGTNNLTNSPVQMKQVGVIRPIITNKTVSSNATFPSKYSVNKPHSVLTEREIEKNLINKVKSIEQPVTKVIVSLKKSPEECIVNNVNNETNKQNDENNKKGQIVWDKKPNTMVFNFCNRKTVPDYIENDGLILTSKKERPKRGEPGIIFLGGSTDDSSTDFDVDEFITDPPSPCDIIFEGDNILINGKSNIQLKPKQRKLKLQFNDEATTMFEYPSEASLLDDHGSFDLESELEKNLSTSGANNSPGLPNPFRCGNLASYTPSKVSMSSDFQLGVTKTPPLPPNPPPRTESKVNEDDEDEYLRPADENNTIVWSSETAADLLF